MASDCERLQEIARIERHVFSRRADKTPVACPALSRQCSVGASPLKPMVL
ncbi:MAG: hypothetical protein AAGU32_18515 [Bacillota bacterium]